MEDEQSSRWRGQLQFAQFQYAIDTPTEAAAGMVVTEMSRTLVGRH